MLRQISRSIRLNAVKQTNIERYIFKKNICTAQSILLKQNDPWNYNYTPVVNLNLCSTIYRIILIICLKKKKKKCYSQIIYIEVTLKN